MSKSGGIGAHTEEHMTEAEAKHRLQEAREQMMRAKTRHARNLWKHLIVKRQRHLKEIVERRKRLEKPHVVGHNRIVGGDPEERLLYGMHVAHKEFRLFYDEYGAETTFWGLTNVPNDAYRSDCSGWSRDLHRVCKVRCVPFTYTGNALELGKVCDQHYAETHTGVGVIFGSGTGFHMGLSTGHGPTIFQHGTPSLRKGTFGQFGPGIDVRYRILTK